ncbi:MAG: AF1514 family protein [Pseudomonadota bacterium]
MSKKPISPDVCPLPQPPDESGLTKVSLSPDPPPGDYREAMALAEVEATRRLGDYMLLSWYDRDRDFESPQHAGECHLDSAVPGYVDYALYRGANLKVDIGDGRFVFYYLGVDL